MSGLDVARLREVAEAATPGPWGVASTEGMGWAVHRGEHDTVALYSARDDADHIAAFDPPTVLALLDRLKAAEAKVARVEALLVDLDAEATSLGMWEGAPYEDVAERLRAALDGDA